MRASVSLIYSDATNLHSVATTKSPQRSRHNEVATYTYTPTRTYSTTYIAKCQGLFRFFAGEGNLLEASSRPPRVSKKRGNAEMRGLTDQCVSRLLAA